MYEGEVTWQRDTYPRRCCMATRTLLTSSRDRVKQQNNWTRDVHQLTMRQRAQINWPTRRYGKKSHLATNSTHWPAEGASNCSRRTDVFRYLCHRNVYHDDFILYGRRTFVRLISAFSNELLSNAELRHFVELISAFSHSVRNSTNWNIFYQANQLHLKKTGRWAIYCLHRGGKLKPFMTYFTHLKTPQS